MELSQNKKSKMKSVLANIWKYFKYIFIGGTSNQRIFRSYIYIVLIGTILLITPWAVNKVEHRSFMSALFTASSAFSDTGLTLYNAARDLTFFGQLVVLVLIQVGGLGIMTLKVILYILIGQTISIQQRILLQSERGGSKLGGTVELIKSAFFVLIFVEVIGAISLFFYFYFCPIDYLDSLKTFSVKVLADFLKSSFSNEKQYLEVMNRIPELQDYATSINNLHQYIIENYNSTKLLELISKYESINGLESRLINSLFLQTYHNFDKSFWSAIFHSVSATNNAGFDIIGPNSLVPYRTHYFVQIVFIIQLIIGGIGYPVFYDIRQKIIARLNGTSTNLSLFSKVSLIIYSAVTIVGITLVLLVEYLSPVNVKDEIGRGVSTQTSGTLDNVMAIIFSTFSTRSAGYTTVDINAYKLPSKFIFSIMMWIGASPASTGGGIRTTTLAVVILAIFSTAVKRKSVNILKSKIPLRTIQNAISVFALSLVLVFAVIIIIISQNSQISLMEAIFTTSSAFGTVGLTINNDFGNSFNEYKILSKILLMLLMFIGQLGLSNTILILAQKDEVEYYSYAEEDLLIG